MSIYFYVEGSPASKQAADVCIAAARKFHSDVVAQFVIDPQRLFEIEGFSGLPGLCGSGVFIDTEQKLISPLSGLGESLLASFCTLAEGQFISVKSFVDIGAVVDEVRSRSSECEIRIMGYSEQNMELALALPLTQPTLLVEDVGQSRIIAAGGLEEVRPIVEWLLNCGMELSIMDMSAQQSAQSSYYSH